jgi:hypothetical protein
MIRIQPDWCGELLSMWAAKDWSDAQGDLGFPHVSPMFAKTTAFAAEVEDVEGYSSAELRAMTAAVDWLQLNHSDHWRALSREFRQWTKKDLQAKDNDRELVLEAGKLLAKYIDETLG